MISNQTSWYLNRRHDQTFERLPQHKAIEVSTEIKKHYLGKLKSWVIYKFRLINHSTRDNNFVLMYVSAVVQKRTLVTFGGVNAIGS